MSVQTQKPGLAAQTFEVPRDDGPPFRFVGQLLGSATSHMPEHNHVVPKNGAPLGAMSRCSACRWFEVAIYRLTITTVTGGVGYDAGSYLVHKMGMSAVHGEEQRNTLIFTDSPYEVVEILTVRGGDRPPHLPMPSARVLSAAAVYDAGIKDAYINRAVV
jgi:hypothetical protein